MKIELRCTISEKNLYLPIDHLSSSISADLQSISGFNIIFINTMYVLQKIFSIHTKYCTGIFSKLDPKLNLNLKDDSLD